jgi:poly(A) polymerase
MLSQEMIKHKPILATLTGAGYKAFFVGGCVRDSLLGRPCHDVDITTSATPDQVAALFPESKHVGAHFGVTIVRLGEMEAEVATFRTDGCYSDSRRPDSVQFTTDVVEDVRRRDFTINALLMDITGEVFDYVDGMYDLLRKQQICAIHNPYMRFKEDALRMLRAIRFAARLGFPIEAETFKAIQKHAPTITKVSGERVRDELSKILTSGRAVQGLLDLDATGLLREILPEVAGLHACEQNAKHHPEGDVFKHTMKLLEQLEPGCSLTLALAALLHDIGKPVTAGVKDDLPTFYGHEEQSALMARVVLRRLKFPSDVIDTVVDHCAQHMIFRYTVAMRKAKLLRFLRQPNFAELLDLHKLDATAGSGNLDHHTFCVQTLAEIPCEVLRPVRFVTGTDLIAMGFKPGPKFKEILDALETEQLEGRIPGKEEAFAFVAGRA